MLVEGLPCDDRHESLQNGLVGMNHGFMLLNTLLCVQGDFVDFVCARS